LNQSGAGQGNQVAVAAAVAARRHEPSARQPEETCNSAFFFSLFPAICFLNQSFAGGAGRGAVAAAVAALTITTPS